MMCSLDFMQDYDAMLDAEERVRGFKAARAEHRAQGAVPPEFRIGELYIRKILLGSPNSARLSKTAPSWVR